MNGYSEQSSAQSDRICDDLRRVQLQYVLLMRELCLSNPDLARILFRLDSDEVSQLCETNHAQLQGMLDLKTPIMTFYDSARPQRKNAGVTVLLEALQSSNAEAAMLAVSRP
ncbi:hypothetical protein K0504_10100 [Neiella marina]|uniref:Flagellar transcriptional regulator FlhD n=1 Tax=Neiella holothuriorum TaxID=2870530 RepID=A0ABS7EGR1_9GAMM|nr:hypothetical protein [Neiella holothuriorum]MBW8191390.1 hypothetical protein [Neiella holothuriorum]